MGIVVLWAAVAGVYPAAPAQADWFLGDPHKMHFPQMPNPDGWDVYPLDVHEFPDGLLADDWQCSQTGPVTGIHLWGSWAFENPHDITDVHLRIHENVPADPNVPGSYSQPGQLLWERAFAPNEFTVISPYGSGDQGWHDPNGFYTERHDHSQFHQINLENISNPFVQQFGEIYWLNISVGDQFPDPFSPGWGWKTSQDHFMDGAVWRGFGGGPEVWRELCDPITGAALDMAFVITGEGSCIDPPPDMVAWWSLDETSGMTATEIVNGNDGNARQRPDAVER